MNSTRILRSAAEKAHALGFLLPPRTSMDILASAGNALLNLFTNEDQRKRFATLVNSGIISPEVLGQANLAYFRILALHHELDSPTLKEHGFNVAEFLDGVKPALEQLHEVQANLQNELNDIATTAHDSVDEDEDNDNDDLLNISDKNTIPSMMFPNTDNYKAVKRLLKKTNGWKQVAERDPESYEARLVAMLSPKHLERFELASKLSFVFAPQFHDLDVKVHNVALLSARGMIVESDEDNEIVKDDDEITSDEAKQKVVDSGEASDKKVPAVAAQIEVLYDVEETLIMPADASEDESQEKEKKSDDAEQEETKTVTRTSVVVGVFEGWLSGGDEEGLRWRVADIRYPFEFPFLTTRGLNE